MRPHRRFNSAVLRLARVKRLLDRWEEDLYSVAMYKMGKLLIIVFGIAHWLACAWYFFGGLADDNTDAEGLPLTGWCELLPCTLNSQLVIAL